jgi:hypothetical protein
MRKGLVLLGICVMLGGCGNLPVTSDEILVGNIMCDGFGGIYNIQGKGQSIFSASPWTQEVICKNGAKVHMHEDFIKNMVKKKMSDTKASTN